MTMDKAFLAAYSLRLIATCHRRGAFAMGGMSAFIPVKGDEAANRAALDKVRADKLREVGNGHDGTWVAHPGAGAGRAGGVRGDGRARTSCRRCPTTSPAATRCWSCTQGPRTEAGARENIRVGVQYLAAWLGGQRRGAALQSDGGCGDGRDLPRPALAMAAVRSAARRRPPLHARPVRGAVRRGNERACSGSPQHRPRVRLFREMVTADEFEEFLTLPAYPLLG